MGAQRWQKEVERVVKAEAGKVADRAREQVRRPVEDVSSWQGFFRRMVRENPEASFPAVRHLPVDDPWATTKSA